MNKRQAKKHAKKFLAAGYYGSPAEYSHRLYGVFPIPGGNWEAVFEPLQDTGAGCTAQVFNRRGYCRS